MRVTEGRSDTVATKGLSPRVVFDTLAACHVAAVDSGVPLAAALGRQVPRDHATRDHDELVVDARNEHIDLAR
jgi:hypothetical protein